MESDLRKYRRNIYLTDSLYDEKKQFADVSYDKKEDDYTVYDIIISKMNLKRGELATLNCYMAGMTYCETAKFLGVNFSTVYRRKMSLRKKYLQNIN